LLGKRRDEQPQSFELFRVEHVLEELVEVAQRHQLTLRDVAEIWTRREVDRRGGLGQQMVGQIEVEVEPAEIALRLALGLEGRPRFGSVARGLNPL